MCLFACLLSFVLFYAIGGLMGGWDEIRYRVVEYLGGLDGWMDCSGGFPCPSSVVLTWEGARGDSACKV